MPTILKWGLGNYWRWTKVTPHLCYMRFQWRHAHICWANKLDKDVYAYMVPSKFISIGFRTEALMMVTATTGKRGLPSARSKALKALGKSFAECHPRQSPHGNQSDGKEIFAECYFRALSKDLHSAGLALGKRGAAK